jgi:hypothetical protein
MLCRKCGRSYTWSDTVKERRSRALRVVSHVLDPAVRAVGGRPVCRVVRSRDRTVIRVPSHLPTHLPSRPVVARRARRVIGYARMRTQRRPTSCLRRGSTGQAKPAFWYASGRPARGERRRRRHPAHPGADREAGQPHPRGRRPPQRGADGTARTLTRPTQTRTSTAGLSAEVTSRANKPRAAPTSTGCHLDGGACEFKRHVATIKPLPLWAPARVAGMPVRLRQAGCGRRVRRQPFSASSRRVRSMPSISPVQRSRSARWRQSLRSRSSSTRRGSIFGSTCSSGHRTQACSCWQGVR